MCSLAGVTPAFASTNLETGSSLAGISVALNNYYAGNAQPEKKLASSYDQLEATAKNNSSISNFKYKGRNESPDIFRSQSRDKSSSPKGNKSSCFTDKGGILL